MEPDNEADRQDGPSGRSVAAGSVGAFFKKMEWDVVSFFPNSLCVKKQKKTTQDKKN